MVFHVASMRCLIWSLKQRSAHLTFGKLALMHLSNSLNNSRWQARFGIAETAD